MSYGIYDCDITRKGAMFNLELMKLAAYYKSKGEIVSYSSRFAPERYNNFIVGKDRIDENFRLPIYEYDNLQTVGRFFSPKKYFPMDLQIERQVPDTYIYNRVLDKYDLKIREKNIYKSMLSGEHLRLSLDSENIWSEYEKQIQGNKKINSFTFYDYNISKIKDAPEAIEKLTYRHKGKFHPIFFKFPIQAIKAAELEPWFKFQHHSHKTVYIINNLPTDEDIAFFKEYQEIIKRKKVYYNISSNNNYKTLIDNIHKLYLQMYFLRTIMAEVSLIYNDNFFVDEEWKTFIILLNHFIFSYYYNIDKYKRKGYNDFFTYVRRLFKRKKVVNNLTIEDVKKCFYFISQVNYPLFKDLYEYEGEE